MQDQQNQITALEKRIAELEEQLADLQSRETARFNRIECSEMQIVSDTGTPLITLSGYDEETKSPIIKVHGNTGIPLVLITSCETGGGLSVWSTPQIGSEPEVSIEMSVNENRNGHVAVCDSDGDYRSTLGVSSPRLGGAGRIAIHGAVDNRERVVIGCNPETDNGSLKTYSGMWHETHSLENEPGDLREFDAPRGNPSDLHFYQHALTQVEEKLQNETNEDLKRFLSGKKAALLDFISHYETA